MLCTRFPSAYWNEVIARHPTVQCCSVQLSAACAARTLSLGFWSLFCLSCEHPFPECWTMQALLPSFRSSGLAWGEMWSSSLGFLSASHCLIFRVFSLNRLIQEICFFSSRKMFEKHGTLLPSSPSHSPPFLFLSPLFPSLLLYPSFFPNGSVMSSGLPIAVLHN